MSGACDFCKFRANCNEWKRAIIWSCPDYEEISSNSKIEESEFKC